VTTDLPWLADDTSVADIQRIFADTWIDKAEKGWWVQKQDGTSVKK
jgi:hypothetical protein